MNTKYLIIPALGLASAVGLTGCYEMDTLPMDQYVTEGEKVSAVEANPEMAQASITGISALFSTFLQVISERENHSDFGYASLMIASDTRGIDLVSESLGYNWYSGEVEFSDCSDGSDFTRMAWNSNYRQIFAANAALKSLNPDTEDPEIQFYLGQAHAFGLSTIFSWRRHISSPTRAMKSNHA